MAGRGDLGLLSRGDQPEEDRPAPGGFTAAAPAMSLTASGAGDAPHIVEPQGELIEPGRTLALADFAPPSVGAGERLMRLAYRLGVPGGALSAPFRKPAKPRLLATVTNPLPGNRSAGTALRAGFIAANGGSWRWPNSILPAAC